MFVINKFYDTNALLLLQEKVLEEQFNISSVSLRELENIKVSQNKDAETKYKARRMIHILDNNEDMYNVVFPDGEGSPDELICQCASKIENVLFITNDLCCKSIAKYIYHLNTQSVNDNSFEKYSGFKNVVLSEEEMSYMYGHMNDNNFGLINNEYLIVKNSDNNIVDKLCWSNNVLRSIKIGTLKSDYFGNIKPYNGDIYQQCALDSLVNNQVTMIKGKAGTGKSYLALGYLFYLLEKHKIEKIIVFCNTVATANSAKLGYYPGSKDEKLLDSTIGNMLGSKLGGLFAVERLIQDGKLVLLPMSDIRGFDTTNMNAGVYITEAQNMDISLMKLALQRIGEDCICIIDGDYDTQVDLSQYAGANNGMRRMSEVFRGNDFYGEVELQNIYRSRIAAVAEAM